MTRRMTLNLGLRYEYVSPYTEDRNNLLNLDYSTLPAAPVLRPVTNAVESRPQQFRAASRHRRAAARAVFTRRDLPRRLWSLLQSRDRRRDLRSAAQRRAERGERAATLTPVLTFQNGFPQTPPLGSRATSGSIPMPAPLRAAVDGGLSARGARPDRYSMSTYIGAKGTRARAVPAVQHSRARRNRREPAAAAGRPSVAAHIPASSGPLFQREHLANSIYHSLQIKVEKRLLGTLCRSSPALSGASPSTTPTAWCPGSSRASARRTNATCVWSAGLSFFDVRRRFSGGFVYLIPTAPWLRPVVRNWQLTGTLTFQDGTPLNPVYFVTDFANSGTPNRPNVVPGQSILALAAEPLPIISTTRTRSAIRPLTRSATLAGTSCPARATLWWMSGLSRRFAIAEDKSDAVPCRLLQCSEPPEFRHSRPVSGLRSVLRQGVFGRRSAAIPVRFEIRFLIRRTLPTAAARPRRPSRR